MLKKAGLEGKDTVFLFTDTQIVQVGGEREEGGLEGKDTVFLFTDTQIVQVGVSGGGGG